MGVLEIITGYKGEPHVSQSQMRDIYKSIYGSGTYITDIGSKLAATIVSANEIRIADGLLVAEGCAAEVSYGDTVSLAIANGTQGMLRRDLIVARYSRAAGTNIEDMEFVVITGTPAASNPALPAYTSGSIADGDMQVDFPVYEVDIDGITVTQVVKLAAAAYPARATTIVKSYPFSISYAAGNVGTRAARITLTSDYREDIGFDDVRITGLVIDGFTATTAMHLEATVNGHIIYLCAYRATGAAANGVSGVLMVTFTHDD